MKLINHINQDLGAFWKEAWAQAQGMSVWCKKHRVHFWVCHSRVMYDVQIDTCGL